MLTGYADKLSVRPGDAVEFKVTAAPAPYRMSLVRLGGVTDGSGEHGTVQRTTVDHPSAGEYVGRCQRLLPGSYGHVDLDEPIRLKAILADVWALPTVAHGDRQVLLSSPASTESSSWAVGIVDGSAFFDVVPLPGSVGQCVSVSLPRTDPHWIRILAEYDPRQGQLRLTVHGQGTWANDPYTESAAHNVPAHDASLELTGFTVAAQMTPFGARDVFNGKVESPRVFEASGCVDIDPPNGPTVDAATCTAVAAWDFSQQIESDIALDTGAGCNDLRLVHHPTRAVTGHTWDGATLDFRQAPAQWGAIHFHSDDLADAGWSTDFVLDIPEDLPSGLYAAHLEQGGEVDDIPFYVRPAVDSRAEVLFLAPTNTYLAYANEHLAHGERGPAHESMMAAPIELSADDVFLRDHPEFGLSLYDTHADGSGVTYSSRLRPILNLRPDYLTWLNAGRRHLAADCYLLGWLDSLDIDYDIATDEDLDEEGVELLARYRVLVTGTHPEYVTEGEYDAIRKFTGLGGRVMYLGANGFFWVTSYTSQARDAVECRRGMAAQRNWTSHPAELHHSSTGELGGAWLHRGVNSREIFGVGMCAAGWGPASGYSRQPASYDVDLVDLFDGIGERALGEHGLVLGGAAGDELDSADFNRGTPSHARVLLTSRHREQYLPTLEAVQSISPTMAGEDNPEVRADVVLMTTAGGGAVFSTGSICWAGSMAWNNYENPVSTLTTSVLDDSLGTRPGLATPAHREAADAEHATALIRGEAADGRAPRPS